MDYRTYLKHYPDKDGRFGPYGGAYLTEELLPAFEEIADAYQTICHSSQFINAQDTQGVPGQAHTGLPLRAAVQENRELPDLPEARRFKPHRRA